MEQYQIKKDDWIEFGLDDHLSNPHTGQRITQQQRIQEIIEEAKLAEEAGIDFFGLGESHQEYFTAQAHTVVLGAIVQVTKNIKISSVSTIIST